MDKQVAAIVPLVTPSHWVVLPLSSPLLSLVKQLPQPSLAFLAPTQGVEPWHTPTLLRPRLSLVCVYSAVGKRPVTPANRMQVCSACITRVLEPLAGFAPAATM